MSPSWTSAYDAGPLTSTGAPHGRPTLHLESKCMPSPGGQISGMAGARNPVDLPKGYHTPGPGAELHKVGRWFRRGLPPGRRAVGLRQVDGMPHEPGAVWRTYWRPWRTPVTRSGVCWQWPTTGGATEPIMPTAPGHPSQRQTSIMSLEVAADGQMYTRKNEVDRLSWPVKPHTGTAGKNVSANKISLRIGTCKIRR